MKNIPCGRMGKKTEERWRPPLLSKIHVKANKKPIQQDIKMVQRSVKKQWEPRARERESETFAVRLSCSISKKNVSLLFFWRLVPFLSRLELVWLRSLFLYFLLFLYFSLKLLDFSFLQLHDGKKWERTTKTKNSISVPFCLFRFSLYMFICVAYYYCCYYTTWFWSTHLPWFCCLLLFSHLPPLPPTRILFFSFLWAYLPCLLLVAAGRDEGDKIRRDDPCVVFVFGFYYVYRRRSFS